MRKNRKKTTPTANDGQEKQPPSHVVLARTQLLKGLCEQEQQWSLLARGAPGTSLATEAQHVVDILRAVLFANGLRIPGTIPGGAPARYPEKRRDEPGLNKIAKAAQSFLNAAPSRFRWWGPNMPEYALRLHLRTNGMSRKPTGPEMLLYLRDGLRDCLEHVWFCEPLVGDNGKSFRFARFKPEGIAWMFISHLFGQPSELLDELILLGWPPLHWVEEAEWTLGTPPEYKQIPTEPMTPEQHEIIDEVFRSILLPHAEGLGRQRNALDLAQYLIIKSCKAMGMNDTTANNLFKFDLVDNSNRGTEQGDGST